MSSPRSPRLPLLPVPGTSREAAAPARERVGLAMAALCALGGAFIAPVARAATLGMDPVFVATASTSLGALAAALVLAWRGRLTQLFGPLGPKLAAVGLLGTAVPYLLFFVGTSRTSAIEAALYLQAEPAYSLALAWLVLGHRPTPQRAVAITLLLGGIALAVGLGGSGDWLGSVLLLATPIGWQLSHLVVLRWLPGVSSTLLTGARYVWGGVMLTAGAPLFAGPAFWPDTATLTANLPGLVLYGVVLSYLGTLCWYQTIARLDLARATAIVVPSIPLLSVVVSFALLGEVPTAMQVAGMAVVGVGVLLFVRAPHPVERVERVPAAAAPVAVEADTEGFS